MTESEATSPSIDLQSQASESQSDSSPIFDRRQLFKQRNQIDRSKTITQVIEEFNLRPTYQNLEGHESLSDEQLKHLMAYSLVLAKDQAGCRFLQS